MPAGYQLVLSQEQVKEWIARYQQEGLCGWKVQAGRGRKPAFSPSL
jgi:MarR-like DNA-binding transcriptional regulator SgrR of sgrS sRNA